MVSQVFISLQKYSGFWQDWLFSQPQTEDIKSRQGWSDLLNQLQAKKQE